MLSFQSFQDNDNLLHALNFLPGFLQAYPASGYPARINRLTQPKLALGALNQL
jgi:hypothetical protein